MWRDRNLGGTSGSCHGDERGCFSNTSFQPAWQPRFLPPFIVFSALMASLDNTHGAYLIGVVVAALLHGCTCLQAWHYYTHYPLDWWSIKLLVAAVIFLETCHQALITHALYTYLITHFGDLEALSRLVLSPIVGDAFPFMTVLLTRFTIQIAIYVNYILSPVFLNTARLQAYIPTFHSTSPAAKVCLFTVSHQSWLATGSTMIVVIAQLVLVIFYASKAVGMETFAQLATLKDSSMGINGMSAAGDLLIAVLLSFLLKSSRTGFQRSDTIINRLISAWPRTFIYMVFYFNIGRLYCNSLLTTLNARKELRSDSHNDNISLQTTQARVNHSFLESRRVLNQRIWSLLLIQTLSSLRLTTAFCRVTWHLQQYHCVQRDMSEASLVATK
ncbi:hypothetical protein V8E55_001739 [Tylopilus felleus]